MAKYRWAAAWTTDETAKKAVFGTRQQFHKTLKRNSPWTQSAVSYARADKTALNGIRAGNRRNGRRGIAWEALHVAIADASRLAYAAVLPDETKQSAITFMSEALTFFA